MRRSSSVTLPCSTGSPRSWLRSTTRRPKNRTCVSSPDRRLVRSRLLGGAVALAVLLAFCLQTRVVSGTGFWMGDFRAFYCAARVAAHRADPYLTEPLRSCEVAIGTTPFFRKNPGVTIPAPLPGYAIAALMPLGV